MQVGVTMNVHNVHKAVRWSSRSSASCPQLIAKASSKGSLEWCFLICTDGFWQPALQVLPELKIYCSSVQFPTPWIFNFGMHKMPWQWVTQFKNCAVKNGTSFSALLIILCISCVFLQVFLSKDVPPSLLFSFCHSCSFLSFLLLPSCFWSGTPNSPLWLLQQIGSTQHYKRRRLLSPPPHCHWSVSLCIY